MRVVPVKWMVVLAAIWLACDIIIGPFFHWFPSATPQRIGDKLLDELWLIGTAYLIWGKKISS